MFRTPLNNQDAPARVFRHRVWRFVAPWADFTGLAGQAVELL